MAKEKKHKVKRKLSAYNRHMSAEMKKGKTFKQAVSSWKGGHTKASHSTKTKSKRFSRLRAKIGGHHKMGFNQQKIFKLARMAALLGPHAAVWMSAASPQDKAAESIKLLSGFDMATGQFDASALVRGYFPLLAATAITTLIPKASSIIRGIM